MPRAWTYWPKVQLSSSWTSDSGFWNVEYKVFYDLFRKCPGCQSPIQKSDGCNHMTCKQCKSQFCWICLGQYTIHHYKIYNCWGCSGLQYDEKIEDRLYRKVKKISFFFVLPFFALFCLALTIGILPLNLLYQLVAQPCEWIGSKEIMWEKRIVKNCCNNEDISYILLYFAMIPRSFVFILGMAPCLYLNKAWTIFIGVLWAAKLWCTFFDFWLEWFESLVDEMQNISYLILINGYKNSK